MKKLLALTLAILMVFSLTACSTLLDQFGALTGKKFERGTVSGRKYESNFIGIGCELSAEWKYKSDAEIKEMNNIVSDMMDEEIAEAMEEGAVLYDMMAISSNGRDNILVTLEKVNPVALKKLDISKNFEKAYASVASSFQNMGYTDVEHTISTGSIDGKTFETMKITGRINGISMYQINFCVKCNGYLASVAITTMGADRTADLMQTFYIID